MAVEKSRNVNAQCECSSDTLTAFMQGKLKVEGDMGNAMQLQGVLAKLRG